MDRPSTSTHRRSIVFFEDTAASVDCVVGEFSFIKRNKKKSAEDGDGDREQWERERERNWSIYYYFII